MFRIAGLLILFAALALPLDAAQAAFVTLNNGALVPCDHPLAIAEGKGCGTPGIVTPPAPPATGTPLLFHVGHSYLRPSDGQRIHVMGMGQYRNAVQVFFFECLNTAYSGCPKIGDVWPVVANATADGWLDVAARGVDAH